MSNEDRTTEDLENKIKQLYKKIMILEESFKLVNNTVAELRSEVQRLQVTTLNNKNDRRRR